MVRLLVLCLLTVSAAAAEAATCTSRTDGNWSAALTWNCDRGLGFWNGPPQDGDAVVVRGQDALTLNSNTANLASLAINVNGANVGSITDDGGNRLIALSGNLVNNGNINGTSAGARSSIRLQGASVWSGNGTANLAYLDTNWNTLTLDTASSMLIALRDATPLRNVNAFNNGSAPNRLATVQLNGAAQGIPVDGLKMPNLRVSGGTKTVSGGALLTILGSLTIDAGATFDAQSNSISVALGGNLSIGGTLRALGSGTWTFNGSSVQNISAAATIRGVTLNNAAGLTLGGNLTIGDTGWGPLTLSSGKLTTGTYAVVIPRICQGSMVTRTAGSWINGSLQLTMPDYDRSCVFDIGDNYNYSPLTFSYPWHAAPLGGTVTASATGGDHPDTTAGSSGINANKSVNRYWTLIAGSAATFYTYDAVFQYCSAVGGADCTVNDVDAAANASNFTVAEKTSSGWGLLTPTAPTGSTRRVTGISAFGAFAIGEAGTASTCPQPANTPAGLSLICQCDSFGRTNLNPSPMFGNGNWTVSTSDSTGVVPYIRGSTGFLRLTENTGNNAKAATAPGFFPAAGNYISVEFKHYAYNGSGGGADGIGVVLSDYSVAPVPGAFGGSLGYAQKPGIPGFAGGWIGVGVDEYGNFSNPTEDRVGGPGLIADGVAVRGSGSAQAGYRYLRGTSSALSPGVDNPGATSPAYGHFYQIIVDARNSAAGQTWVAVNRDTGGTGNSYSPVVPSFDAYAVNTGYTQAPVPTNWQLSFTGSTGGSTNIHELGQVRICAQYYVPPDGGVAGGFSAIDEAYSSVVQNFLSGHIYTKLAGTPFKLKVAALTNSQIQTTYAAGGNKNVTLKLVDNSAGVCGTDAERATACTASACKDKAAVSGGSQTLVFSSADKGIRTSGDFTLNSAYSNLVAVISDGTTTACSIDTFAVRPTLLTQVTSTANNAALTGTPKLKAGTDSFTMTVVANATGYTGKPKINAAGMKANAAGWTLGGLTPVEFNAAEPAVSTSTASGSFKYSEVGHFYFLGYSPAKDTTSSRGIHDDDWVAVDSAATKNDCVVGSYSNIKNGAGKYGCLFGLTEAATNQTNWPLFGRFVPDHFTYLGGGVVPFCPDGGFTYMGQPKLGIAYRLQAESGDNKVTANYSKALGYPVTNPALVAEDQDAAQQGCDLAGRIGGLPAAQWAGGIYLMNDALINSNGQSGNDDKPDTATATFSRPPTPVALTTGSCAANRNNAGGPFRQLDLGVSMNDTDAEAVLREPDMNAATTATCSGADCNARKIGSTAILYGRLWLNSAYGSEMLPLLVPAQAQYWTPRGWQKNVADNCSQLIQPTSGNDGLKFYEASSRNALAAGEVVSQMGGSTAANVSLVGGDARLILRHPDNSSQGPGAGNFGYVDVIGSKLSPSTWLPPSGNARACFGACGPRSSLIYLRENY